ncbi:hypothetical protein V2N93_10730, partial [Streptococcus pneumoniae]
MVIPSVGLIISGLYRKKIEEKKEEENKPTFDVSKKKDRPHGRVETKTHQEGKRNPRGKD